MPLTVRSSDGREPKRHSWSAAAAADTTDGRDGRSRSTSDGGRTDVERERFMERRRAKRLLEHYIDPPS